MNQIIDTWEQRLADQVKRNYKNYFTLRITLDAAANNQQHIAAGDMIYVKAISSSNAASSIKLNRNTNEEIELKLHSKIKTVFTSFYITNTAQAGEWIDLLIGINFDIENILDRKPAAQPAIVITNALADTNTQGASHSCNEVLLRAAVGNAGMAWVNFGDAAVEDACMPIEAGEVVSVKLANTSDINVLFKSANDKIFVTYEA